MWLRLVQDHIAVQVILASRRVKILAAYLSPSRPMIRSDLSACFGGGLAVLIAGDLNAKHVDWNSRLYTKRGKLLPDCVDGNSCLIFGPDTSTTNPYNSSATPDVFDIVMVKKLPFPMYLTSCSALSSDHLPYSSTRVFHPFNTQRNALISGAMTGPTSKLT